jgi:hypothetical protein
MDKMTPGERPVQEQRGDFRFAYAWILKAAYVFLLNRIMLFTRQPSELHRESR